MEIEYVHGFWNNFMPAGLSILRVFLWCIPVYFLVRFIRNERTLKNLVVFIILSAFFFVYEYQSINSRFNKILYAPGNIALQTLQGAIINISPSEIQRFWSISIGRNGGYSCYLLVKLKNSEYRSVNVLKREHSCKQDAEMLNFYYRKM